ncbi:MAG: response regulator transcription factor [Verrucomicrobiales bacterium]
MLDVAKPGLDGPRLQERLTEDGILVPIVFLSGHADIPTSVRAMKAGAVDFLTKPVESDVLVRSWPGDAQDGGEVARRIGAGHGENGNG